VVQDCGYDRFNDYLQGLEQGWNHGENSLIKRVLLKSYTKERRGYLMPLAYEEMWLNVAFLNLWLGGCCDQASLLLRLGRLRTLNHGCQL
jgi:hypothetical protein